MVYGVIRNEIPNSMYHQEDRTVTILSATDSYRYQLVGTDEGTYSLSIACVEDGEATTFSATDIPTASGAVHGYSIAWDASLAVKKESVFR